MTEQDSSWAVLVDQIDDESEVADDENAGRDHDGRSGRVPTDGPMLAPEAELVECHPVGDVDTRGERWEGRVDEALHEARSRTGRDQLGVVPALGGFGMNTGVQSAHNLAWKLAIALSGSAGPALLDSFEQERHPVGDYVPVARPGHRGPHAWIGHEGRTISTLDTVRHGFALLCSSTRPWVALAVEHDIRPFAIDERHVQEAFGLGDDGAVLLRPDGYVAARWPHDPGASVTSEFRATVRRARGWS